MANFQRLDIDIDLPKLRLATLTIQSAKLLLFCAKQFASLAESSERGRRSDNTGLC
jgi:hypothetical protein